MWRPYIKVIEKKAGKALHILDRFHISPNSTRPLTKSEPVSVGKCRKMGYKPVLKHSRWCLLKRWDNLTRKQEAELKELLQHNLKSVRAYLLKKDFNGFWDYVSPAWAEKFLERWCTQAMRSRIEPMERSIGTDR